MAAFPITWNNQEYTKYVRKNLQDTTHQAKNNTDLKKMGKNEMYNCSAILIWETFQVAKQREGTHNRNW